MDKLGKIGILAIEEIPWIAPFPNSPQYGRVTHFVFICVANNYECRANQRGRQSLDIDVLFQQSPSRSRKQIFEDQEACLCIHNIGKEAPSLFPSITHHHIYIPNPQEDPSTA